jgi:hypothetical protein
MPNSITTIGNSAFYNNQITSATISNSVTNIDAYAFRFNQLTNIIIPSSVTSIGGEAFEDNQLTSVTIPSNVTSIGGYAFADNQLTSLTIVPSVVSMGYAAFRNNQLPDNQAFIFNRNSGVEANTVINSYGGAKRNNVIIPNGTKSIGNYAFGQLDITSVSIPNSVQIIGREAFRYNNIIQGNATINNHAANVSVGINVFANNGEDGLTTIFPRYLREAE